MEYAMSLLMSELLKILIPIVIVFFLAMLIRRLILQLNYDCTKPKKDIPPAKRLKYKKREFSPTQDASYHQKNSVKEKGFY